MDGTTRKCKRCGEMYPLTTEFYRVVTGGYLSGICRQCINAAERERRGANPEQCRKARERAKAKNPQASAEYSRRYRERHPERREEQRKNWKPLEMTPERRKKKKEWAAKSRSRPEAKLRHKEYKRQWIAENRDKVSAQYHRRRARLVGAGGAFTAEQLRARYDSQDGRCHWCSAKMTLSGQKKFTIDHLIALAAGGDNSIGNIVCACERCNKSKGAKMPWEFTGRLL